MGVKVENLEKNMAKLTVDVDAAQFDKAMANVYQRTKSRFRLPGFRKGKAPMSMIEKVYGPEVFYEDAVNDILGDTYADVAKESGLSIVSRPEIDVVQVGKGQTLIYTALVAVKPEVTLGEYKGVTVEKAQVDVTEEEIEERLKKELEKNARVIEVEREIVNGDIATIDFVGEIDGEAFAGGSGEDYDLTIGSGTFIPGFEDQLVGHGIGEKVEVNVTFPEQYGAKEVAGKDAVFHVTVKNVKERQIPEADDDFAADVSEFETLEEYKADLGRLIREEKEKQATTANENNVIAKVVENASMDIPEPMMQEQILRLLGQYENSMRAQGIPLREYMQITGQTEEDLKEQMRPEATRNIKNALVLEAVEKAENIEVSDERIDEEMHRIAGLYRMEYEDFVKTVSDSQKESIRDELARQETIDFLVAEANLVDKAE